MEKCNRSSLDPFYCINNSVPMLFVVAKGLLLISKINAIVSILVRIRWCTARALTHTLAHTKIKQKKIEFASPASNKTTVWCLFSHTQTHTQRLTHTLSETEPQIALYKFHCSSSQKLFFLCFTQRNSFEVFFDWSKTIHTMQVQFKHQF